MDAAQALADLAEVSAQIEAAVLVDADGTVLASTLADEANGAALATAARGLLEAAEASEAAGERAQLSHVVATVPGGGVFVVREPDRGRLVAAVTGADPTVGLVVYDLKTCLRLGAGEEPNPEKTPPVAPRQPAATRERAGTGTRRTPREDSGA